MMSPALRAHLRLLASLPVRTHIRPEAQYGQGGNPHYMTPMKYSERKKRIKELHKEGKSPREIAKMEKVTTQTVYNHLRIR